MSLEDITIIRLHSNQQQEAAQVLSRSFLNDPLMVYYFPDTSLRKKILPSLMLAAIRYCLWYGEVYSTEDLFRSCLLASSRAN